jgi:membrane-bound ClpP family serine protease
VVAKKTASKKSRSSKKASGRTKSGETGSAAARPSNTTGTSSTPASKKPVPKPPPFGEFLAAIREDPFEEGNLHAPLRELLLEGASEFEDTIGKYNVVIFYDEGRLLRTDADKLYRSVSRFRSSKPMLLVLHSPGGEIEPAFLMSKLCREHAKGAFEVAVPRRAKSAATLLACGADRIHMGSLSELGPIDPQIDGLPVLALKSALEHIARMSKEVPGAADMLATYLSKVLKLEQLGYYERVAESAVQYAERLLKARSNSVQREARDIAHDLVYKYKDHGFVIDAREGGEVFGKNTIVAESVEYKLSDHLYEKLSVVEYVLGRVVKRDMYYIGSLDQGIHTYPRRKK